MKTETHHKRAIVTAALFVAIGLVLVAFAKMMVMTATAPTEVPSTSTTTAPSNSSTPYRATFVGEYVCLPHVDTTGPQTEECMIGMKTDQGVYFALDFDLTTQNMPSFASGDRVIVTGLMTPIENISSTMWAKYPVRGIVTVSLAEKR